MEKRCGSAAFLVFNETIRELCTFAYVDSQSLVRCRAASRRDAISVTPYVVWGCTYPIEMMDVAALHSATLV